jgi:ribose transport system substrate-binding protein
MSSLLRALFGFAAVLAIAVGVAACGSSSSSTSGSTSEATSSSESESTGSESGSGEVSIDLGSKTLEFPTGTKPKIAFFAYGLSSYELAYKEQLEEMNKEGSDVTWLEAKYEASIQLNQLQTALTSGEYDAFIIEAVDPEGSCRILSEQAPEAGIVVSIIVQPICGSAQNPWGEGVWTPGTLNTVGSNSNVTFFTNALKVQKEELEIGPETKVGVVQGPDISGNAQAYEAALEAAGIEPVEVQAGDYTAPTAQKLTSAMLSREPEIEVFLNGYEGATPGIIAALKEAGKKPGEVKIGDIGGSQEISVVNHESGWITATAEEDPRTIAKDAIEEVENAFAGEQGPRTVSADPPGCTLAKPCQITKATLGSYTPTY